MQTTKEGFVMNTLRLLPRHMVKALAAGTVLVAAALPMALATEAGAVTPPTLTGAWNPTAANPIGTATLGADVAASATTASVTGTAAGTLAAGDVLVDTQGGGDAVLGIVATSVVYAGAGTHAITISASANAGTSGDALTIYAPFSAFGAGAFPSGTAIDFSGTGFIANGSTVSATSSDPDLSFAGLTEVTSTWATGFLVTTAATTTGFASITWTDVNGTSAPLADALYVNPDPTVTGVTPSSVADNQATGALALTGTNLENGATVTFTSTVDGTTLSNAYLTDGVGVIPTTGGETLPSTTGGTSLTIHTFIADNAVTAGAATVGTYTITVSNPDGGSGTSTGIFTVTAYGATSISPASVKTTATGVAAAITGSGFETGATITPGAGCTDVAIVAGTAVVVTPSEITFNVTTTGATSGECTLEVANPNTGGGNGATSTINLGIGTYSSNTAPAVTAVAVSPTTALPVGTGTGGGNPAAATVTITGTGFDPNNGVLITFYVGTTALADASLNGANNSCTPASSGTSIVCTLDVASGAYAGAHSVTVKNEGTDGGTSAAFASAVSVAGPAIASQSPTAIAGGFGTNATGGSPIGTVVTLTGTGFTGTTAAAFAANGDTGLAGIFAVTSATTATFTLTGAATTESTLNPATIILSQTLTNGDVVLSSPFDLAVVPAPLVTGITFVAGTTGVGAGATAQKVVIDGENFAAGATVATFVNAYGVADTVAFTVTSVTSTAITGTVAVPAGDTNISDGYTVTNTSGGLDHVSAFTAGSLVIDTGPTITSVTPATVTADSTDPFTVDGTDFGAGTVLSTNGTNATCGAATIVSSAELTATCTFGAAGTSAVSLVVTNADGGSATSAAVLPAATPPPPPAPPFYISGVHGWAVAGKTSKLTISGSGFFGSPVITSSAPGTKVGVEHDTGTLLTILVTTKTGVSGEYTFTITLANGKSGKKNYAVKK